jgi:hypothetical protein
MSYTEYLRRKAAAAPIIIDRTPKKVDASFYTSQQRMSSNRIFFTSTRVGAINNVNDPSSTPFGPRQPSGNVKISGGRIPDASIFTSYMGGIAIGNDSTSAGSPVRLVANSNNAGSISSCSPIAGPSPYIPGITTSYSANTVPQTASSFTNNTKHCKDMGMLEPHLNNELGPSLFVDNMRPSVPASNTCANGGAAPCKPVIHTHPVVSSYVSTPNRVPPTPMGPMLSTDIGRKVGAATPRIPYVESHHGNDLNVNPRRVAKKYQIPAGVRAHLRINDPVQH